MLEFKQTKDGWIRLSAPAKVNLMLSVHGRRADGFHELTSVVVAVDFGDELELRLNGGKSDTFECSVAEIPTDLSNLVLQAAQHFRKETGRCEHFDFRLKKKIPVGAGLGGGSSDGVSALKGMDALLETNLSSDTLRALAASLGSDCPFFVDAVPAVIRGRGEIIEPLAGATTSQLDGQRMVLFRPPFAINTAWAYGQLASMPELYEEKTLSDERLNTFCRGGSLSDLLHNDFEIAVGRKFLAIPCLLEKLRRLNYKCMMSGSGSACFALVHDSKQAAELRDICFDCWGPDIFWVETIAC